jgi:hypothetical protein
VCQAASPIHNDVCQAASPIHNDVFEAAFAGQFFTLSLGNTCSYCFTQRNPDRCDARLQRKSQEQAAEAVGYSVSGLLLKSLIF